MTFPEQLKSARAAAGLSQVQAAKLTARSVSTLRKWEQGVNTPHATIQAAILGGLGFRLPAVPGSGFFIVNEFDAPRPEMITQMRDGMLHYIHNKNSDFGPMSPLNATPLEDFGVTTNHLNGQLHGIHDAETRATYPDGKTRRWQGPSSFSIFIFNAQDEQPIEAKEIL